MKKKRKMNKRGKFTILIFIIIILFIIGKSIINNKSKNKEIEENHLIATTEYYDLKIDYDKTDIDEIDKKVETYIETQKNEFLKTVEDSKDIMDFRYDFIFSAHTLESHDFIFVNIMTNDYTGGAHYNRQYETYIYNKAKGKYETINDIVKDNNSFNELTLIVKHELLKYSEEKEFEFDEEWLNEGINPIEENYKYFYLDKEGMTIIFPPYQVVYGAIGEIKINLSYEQVNSLLRNEYQNNDQKEENGNNLTTQKRDLEKYKNKKLVAFTFDDGPNTKTTTRLLDGMEKYDAKATFFVLGNRVAYHQEVLKRAYQEGNQIGTHTQNHKNLKLLSNDEFLYEVNNSIIEIKNIIGVEPTLLRPPYGNIDSHMKNQLLMHTILWNVDSIDWKLKDRNLIKKEILKNVSDGSIVLLHDIYTESVEGALLAMEELEKEGYAFVTIEEMAQIKGIDLDYNTSYFNF